MFFSLSMFSCSKDGALDSGNDPYSSDTKSGSYATMLTISNRLYLVNRTAITTYDVINPSNPLKLDYKNVGADIESLFHYNGLLLIGSANNMYIYKINTNGIPERQSNTEYNQIFGTEICTSDPIVVRNNIAYVTLSTITRLCNSFKYENELRVYDIDDIESAKLLKTISVPSPRGLGLGKKHLFVCSDTDGLVVLNIEDALNPKIVKTIGGFSGYDLIVDDNLLIIVTDKALLQYDISDETNIKELGKIKL